MGERLDKPSFRPCVSCADLWHIARATDDSGGVQLYVTCLSVRPGNEPAASPPIVLLSKCRSGDDEGGDEEPDAHAAATQRRKRKRLPGEDANLRFDEMEAYLQARRAR